MTSSDIEHDLDWGGGAVEPVRIIQVTGEGRIDALGRLLGREGRIQRGAAQRFASHARANQIDLNGLWAALDPAGSVIACVLAVPNVGRTAMIFASHPFHPAEVEVIGLLLHHVAAELALDGISISQALLEPEEILPRESLLAGGFRFLANLSYLSRDVPAKGEIGSVAWPQDVTLHQYRDDLRAAFIEALDASYVETQDCPGLCGLRDTSDILMGHQSTGKFNPRLWTLLRIGLRPAGILFFNPAPRSKTIELVYLGLAKWARGRGLGRLLLQHGLREIAGRRESTVTLAVDDCNDPALALYFHAGFRRSLRRVAFIRHIGECVESSSDG